MTIKRETVEQKFSNKSLDIKTLREFFASKAA